MINDSQCPFCVSKLLYCYYISLDRAVGRSEYPGGDRLVRIVVDIICPPPLIELGLTDLPNYQCPMPKTLYGKPIKLIQVVSTSEAHKNKWKDLVFFVFSNFCKIDCFENLV